MVKKKRRKRKRKKKQKKKQKKEEVSPEGLSWKGQEPIGKEGNKAVARARLSPWSKRALPQYTAEVFNGSSAHTLLRDCVCPYERERKELVAARLSSQKH